jgi:dipeptidyl-peptidase 4
VLPKLGGALGTVSTMTMASFLRQLFRTARFTAGAPDQFRITAGGAAVLFLRSRAGDDPAPCLWLADLETAKERLLADPADLLATLPADSPAERARLDQLRAQRAGITSYAIDQAGQLAAFSLAGELWTVEVASGHVSRLVTAGKVTDPQPDPAGQRIGYLSAGALRVIEADGTGDRALAEPDGPDVAFGVADFTAETAVDHSYGYWWAPGGNRLLVVRADFSAVNLWYIADPANPGTPPRAVRYPVTGTANPDVSLEITGLDGQRTPVQWDRAAFEYLIGAGWDAHGPFALVLSRDHKLARFLRIDQDTSETGVLVEQHDNCWVQPVRGLPVRTRSGSLIAHADLDGNRYLTVDGIPVSPVGQQVHAVVGVDGDEILLTASSAAEPTQTQLWRYRPGGEPIQITAEAAVHTGRLRAGTLVQVTLNADRPGGQATVSRAGFPIVRIDSHVEEPELTLHATELVLGARELRGRLFLPSWHRPGRGKLPILADPYGGAGRQRVTAALEAHNLVSQWLAEQGFAVLVVDGRGTPGRGPDWERATHGDLFGPVLADQVDGVREAAKLNPDLDLDRVGIRGWSFGGSLAALAVLRRPDVFHVAVAGAGVTDQRLYNAFWRERTFGHPDEFPQRYDAACFMSEAPNLTRPLLLIHGLADDNVFPLHTLRLSQALLAAGRPHEVLLLAGAGHQAMTENLLWHQVRFLQRHLGVPPTS